MNPCYMILGAVGLAASIAIPVMTARWLFGIPKGATE